MMVEVAVLMSDDIEIMKVMLMILMVVKMIMLIIMTTLVPEV